VHAHVEHSSLCIQTRSERLRYIPQRTYFFSSRSRRPMVVAPFLCAMSEERERTISRVVYTRTPDIVGEIENNNNGDGKKKATKSAVLFNPKQSCPWYADFAEAPFSLRAAFCDVFFAYILATRSRCSPDVESIERNAERGSEMVRRAGVNNNNKIFILGNNIAREH